MSILLLFTPFFTKKILSSRSCTKLSNCIIYKSLFALQVSEYIKYILNNTFLKKKKKKIFNAFKRPRILLKFPANYNQ